MSGVLPLAEIIALERCALNGWPALASVETMGWVLRSANGYTKRANSANPLAPFGDFAALLAKVEAHYGALGLPALIRLSPLTPPGADAALEAAGYARVDPAMVMVASLDHAAADPAVTITASADTAWLTGFAEATGEPPETIVHHAAILGAVAAPHAAASVMHEGRPIAFGLAVVEEERAGLFDIAVSPAHRGRGLARLVSAALLDWARRAGAGSAYLQVREANVPALRTYAALGFIEAYRYHFRMATVSPPATAITPAQLA